MHLSHSYSIFLALHIFLSYNHLRSLFIWSSTFLGFITYIIISFVIQYFYPTCRSYCTSITLTVSFIIYFILISHLFLMTLFTYHTKPLKLLPFRHVQYSTNYNSLHHETIVIFYYYFVNTVE